MRYNVFVLIVQQADLKNRLGEDSPSSRPANAIPVNLDNEAIQLAVRFQKVTFVKRFHHDIFV